MDLVSGEEFVGDVANIKGFSKMLQTWVNKNFNIIFLFLKIFKNFFKFLF